MTVTRFIFHAVKIAPLFMPKVTGGLQERSLINLSRMFTEEVTDEHMKYFLGYVVAPQIETFKMESSQNLTFKTICCLFFRTSSSFILATFGISTPKRQHLCQFKEMKELSLGPSAISAPAFENLSMIPKLETLKTKKCVNLDKLSEMKTLRTLHIKKCPKLTSNIHNYLNNQNFPSLKNLLITKMEINNQQFEEICNNLCDQLEELCVSQCRQLSEKGIKCFGVEQTEKI